MRRLTLIFVTVYLFATPQVSWAAALGCQVQTWLATLYYQADAYSVDYSAATSRTLARHMTGYNQSDLRLNLRQQGLAYMEKSLMKLVAKLENVQTMERRSGRDSAKYLAQHLNLSEQLNSFKQKLAVMECSEHPDWRSMSASELPIPGAMPLRQFGTLVSALAVSAISFAYLASKYIYFLRRLTRRYIVNIDAECSLATQLDLVDIVDLSRRGAKIRIDQPLPRNARILMRFAGEDHPAQVHWQNTNFAGIRFTPVLGPKRLVQILAIYGQEIKAKPWRKLAAIHPPAP